ncbi:MAG TPA: LysR substrate-binding domain-containing protein, partial [Bordetella sp.]|nr:LysR substrate-binding domain-containing protein [Bordetella sp.]
TTSTQLVRTYVSMTDAIAFMPSDAAHYFDETGLLRALPFHLHGLVKPTGVIWSRDHPLEPVAQRFIACLEAVSGMADDAGDARDPAGNVVVGETSSSL